MSPCLRLSVHFVILSYLNIVILQLCILLFFLRRFIDILQDSFHSDHHFFRFSEDIDDVIREPTEVQGVSDGKTGKRSRGSTSEMLWKQRKLHVLDMIR